MRTRVLVAILLGLTLVACGDDDSGGSGTAVPAGDVEVTGSTFAPATVTVGAGDTVTWTFEDSFAHTVTAKDGSFDSGGKTNGDTFDHSFPTAGTFEYTCTIHSTMTGTVEVEA